MSVDTAHIVLLEDDPAQTLWVQQILSGGKYRCSAVSSGEGLLAGDLYRHCALLLVDWELPGISGRDVVELIRRDDPALPIMFVTSRSLEEDIISGLSAGADDYLIKPIRPSILLARIAALLRRPPHPPPAGIPIEIDGYRLQPEEPYITMHGAAVALDRVEYEIARLLLSNFGRIVPRATFEQTIAMYSPHPVALESCLSALRSKLGFRPQNGLRISPVFSHGYRLEHFSG